MTAGDRRTPPGSSTSSRSWPSGLGALETVSAAKHDEPGASLAQGGQFEAPVPEVVRWSVVLDTEGVRDLFTTVPT